MFSRQERIALGGQDFLKVTASDDLEKKGTKGGKSQESLSLITTSSELSSNKS